MKKIIIHLIEAADYALNAPCGVRVTDPARRTSINRNVTCLKCRGTVRFTRNAAREGKQ